MEENTVRVTLSLVGPSVILVFSLAFAGAWLIERKRRYLLFLAGACILFMLGSSVQILWIPPYRGPNAMISAACYTGAVILATEGILCRSGKSFGWRVGIAVPAAVLVALWYFFYIHESLLARIYIQNFSYGFIMLAGALRLSSLRKGASIDRLLFWVFLVFAIQFFLRTVLTMGFSAPPSMKAFAYSPFWQFLQLSLAVLGAGLAFTVLAATISDVMEDLRRARDLDGLTGIFNRKGFEARVLAAMEAAGGRGALILCDIDRFKRINDTHGHDTGDAVLRMFGSVLTRNVRAVDIVGRLGGEEFAVFLPDAELPVAIDCAERIRAAISGSLFPIPGNGKRMRASFGVAEASAGDGWPDLYKRADLRLYEAKARGRNRVMA